MRLVAVVFAAVSLVAACSGKTVDLGPNDPDALAEQAVPTAEELSLDAAESFDLTFDSIFPQPDPGGTPFPLPEGFESCGEFLERLEPPTGLLDPHRRLFLISQANDDRKAFSFTAQVYETTMAARQSYDGWVELANTGVMRPVFETECGKAIAAARAGVDDGTATLVVRERDPGFTIRDVVVEQTKTTVNSSAGFAVSVTTEAVFTRGHVVGQYGVTESGESTADHEELIRAFIQRVIDAQSNDPRR